MLQFAFLDARATLDHLGFIPEFFDNADPRPAIEQINDRYAHGGGWHDLKVGGDRGFRQFDRGLKLHFPGDPPLHAIAEATLHPDASDGLPVERIVIYEHAFVAVFQADGTFKVARLD